MKTRLSIPKKNCASAKATNRGGFTLLEMMLALATFVLLAAAAFALLGGVVETSVTLQDNQSLHDQTVALQAYLKRKICAMPADASITTYLRGTGEGLVQNGIVFGNKNLASAIDAKAQSNGLYTLRIATLATGGGSNEAQDARTVLQQSASTDDPAQSWTTLMTDIKTIDWKFLDYNATNWVELWSNSSHPNLVEFVMQPAADIQSSVMDFWIPKVDALALVVTADDGGSSPTGQSGGANGSGQRRGGPSGGIRSPIGRPGAPP